MAEFPEMKGFSEGNLKYIRRWYLFYNKEHSNCDTGCVPLPAGSGIKQSGKSRNTNAGGDFSPNKPSDVYTVAPCLHPFCTSKVQLKRPVICEALPNPLVNDEKLLSNNSSLHRFSGTEKRSVALTSPGASVCVSKISANKFEKNPEAVGNRERSYEGVPFVCTTPVQVSVNQCKQGWFHASAAGRYVCSGF